MPEVLQETLAGEGEGRASQANAFRPAVLDGLSRTRKSIPCRFLYDERGSRLFDRICELPEYYPTRAEMAILARQAGDIAGHAGPGVQLIELGSGASVKVRLLLDALEQPSSYVPIDISAHHLAEAAARIRRDYPDLAVKPICADFGSPFELPQASHGGRRLAFYPGSTIGNMTPMEAAGFLRGWSRRLGAGARMLIGVDLQKDKTILERAYDDAQGVTAAFSLNILARANRELDADFDLSAFRHEARYDDVLGRIRIHLRSERAQKVRIAGRVFDFASGERLHVEDSWKYDIEGFQRLARGAGYRVGQVWTDVDDLFSVHLLEVAS